MSDRVWTTALLLFANLAMGQEPKPDDKAIRVECHGQLRDGIVAVGGETTGTTLRFQGITWELQFKDRDGKAFAQSHHKQPVTIKGTLRRVTGVERPNRWIVDVDHYAARDPDQTKEGASITLIGRISRDSKDANQWFVESDETVYPVKLPSDAAVQGGQRVSVRGTLEPRPQTFNATPFFVRATKLDLLSNP